MENKDKIIKKIVIALKDNVWDMDNAKHSGDFEEEASCKGYENTLLFVLSLFGISYDEAIDMDV